MNNTATKLTLKGLIHSEDKAREIFENLRWGDNVSCPRCGSDNITKVKANPEKKIREGLYRCKDCRKLKNSAQFTVTVGTIFEDSHIIMFF